MTTRKRASRARRWRGRRASADEVAQPEASAERIRKRRRQARLKTPRPTFSNSSSNANRESRQKIKTESAALLGVAFDAEDGQTRLTRGKLLAVRRQPGNARRHARNRREDQRGTRPSRQTTGRRSRRRPSRDMPRRAALDWRFVSESLKKEGREPIAPLPRVREVSHDRGRYFQRGQSPLLVLNRSSVAGQS